MASLSLWEQLEEPATMPAICVPQPIAHGIIHAAIPMYCINWLPRLPGESEPFHGRFLIHAHEKPDPNFWNSIHGRYVLSERQTINGVPLKDLLPAWYQFPKNNAIGYHRDYAGCGGIVGAATLVETRTRSASPWFRADRRFGLVFDDPIPLPFFRCESQAGVFLVNLDKLTEHYNDLTRRGKWNWPMRLSGQAAISKEQAS